MFFKDEPIKGGVFKNTLNGGILSDLKNREYRPSQDFNKRLEAKYDPETAYKRDFNQSKANEEFRDKKKQDNNMNIMNSPRGTIRGGGRKSLYASKPYFNLGGGDMVDNNKVVNY